MLDYSAPQIAAVAAAKKTVYWLFEFDTTGNGSADYFYAPLTVTWDAQLYTYKIIPESVSDIQLNASGAEIGLQAPNTISFSISDASGALSPSTFNDSALTLRIIVNDIEVNTYLFDVKCYESNYALVCECEDFLQKYLEGDYPKTPKASSLFPYEGIQDDTLQVPIIYNTCYIPVRGIVISGAVYFILGPGGYNYTIHRLHSPREVQDSVFDADDYTFTQYDKIDADGNTWRVFQPIIADVDLDGTPDAPGFWKPGTQILDPIVSFTSAISISEELFAYEDVLFAFTDWEFAATEITTDAEDIIEDTLLNFGLSAGYIDTGVGSSFETAGTTYAGWNLIFSGAFYYAKTRKEVLSNLLLLCHSRIAKTDKIELKVLSKTSVVTITSADIMKSQQIGFSSFGRMPAPKDNNDSGYVAWSGYDLGDEIATGTLTEHTTYIITAAQTDHFFTGNAVGDYFVSDGTETCDANNKVQEVSIKPQDSLTATLVSAKTTTNDPSSDNFINEFVQDPDNVQRAARLKFQREMMKDSQITFSCKLGQLGLQPNDVITVSGDEFGASTPFTAVIDSISIGMTDIQISAYTYSVALDDWDDLSFSDVTINDMTEELPWRGITFGPDGIDSAGESTNTVTGGVARLGTGVSLILEGGANLDIQEGGDIYFRSIPGVTDAERSMAKFPVADDEEFRIYSDYNSRTLSISPKDDYSDTNTSFYVGRDYLDGAKRWNSIYFWAATNFTSAVTGGTDWYSILNLTSIEGDDSSFHIYSRAPVGKYVHILASADDELLTLGGQIQFTGAFFKTTTGDPTPLEGLLIANTFDNNLKIYLDGGWRTLSSW